MVTTRELTPDEKAIAAKQGVSPDLTWECRYRVGCPATGYTHHSVLVTETVARVIMCAIRYGEEKKQREICDVLGVRCTLPV